MSDIVVVYCQALKLPIALISELNKFGKSSDLSVKWLAVADDWNSPFELDIVLRRARIKIFVILGVDEVPRVLLDALDASLNWRNTVLVCSNKFTLPTGIRHDRIRVLRFKHASQLEANIDAIIRRASVVGLNVLD